MFTLQWRRIVMIASLVSLAGIVFASGWSAAVWLAPGYRLAGAYPLLGEAHNLLEDYFVDPMPPQTRLERGMIRGMLEAVEDPYTTYLEPKAHELEAQTLAGEYGGIGVLISADEHGAIFLAPLEASPAEQAGLLEGDYILKVDDLDVTANTSLDEVVAAIRGSAGSQVELTLKRGQAPGEVFTVNITRKTFPLPSVSSYVIPEEPSIGVVHLSGFSDRTQSELEAQLAELGQRGADKLILDLRGNAGGLIEVAADVADFFLDKGIIYVEMDRSGEHVVRAEPGGAGVDLPLAVLVDGGTASAAEVLAGALQANDRALLFGAQTFGKGSVQAVVDLSDGSSMHITTSRWLPAGRQPIDGRGLTPDVRVEVSPDGPQDSLPAAVAWFREGAEGRP